MTTERRHRCGGTLHEREVRFQVESERMLLAYLVPGLVCDRCGEELIERDTAQYFQRSQIPAIRQVGGAVTTTSVAFRYLPASTSVKAFA